MGKKITRGISEEFAEATMRKSCLHNFCLSLFQKNDTIFKTYYRIIRVIIIPLLLYSLSRRPQNFQAPGDVQGLST